jgi:hypothetical protein
MGISIHTEIERAPRISLISLKRLSVSGPLKFIMRRLNQNNVKAGLLARVPLFKISLRECLCSYIIFAPANIPEETRPWASIIHQAPTSLIFSRLNRAKIIIDIWTTEEYAMITFMSLKRQHRIPSKAPPAIQIVEKIKFLDIMKNKGARRYSP